MSVTAASALISHFLPSSSSHHGKSKSQEVRSDFQELSQDLQSGNLAQAQQDFSALNQNIPANQSTRNPLVQDLNSVGTDLKAGDLASARKDFATLQQDIQQAWTQGQGSGTHGTGTGSQHFNFQSASTSVSKDLGTLTQAIQAGSLSSAQQAYASLQADFQQFLASSGSSSSSGSSAVTLATGVNVSV